MRGTDAILNEAGIQYGKLNTAGISAPVFESTQRMVCCLALTDFAAMSGE